MTLRLHIPTSLAVLLLCMAATLFGRLQDSMGPAAPSVRSVSTYPESETGLKSFLQDLLAASKSGDQENILSQLSNLTIPDHAVWFVKFFGPDEGRRLESRYEELLPDLPNKVSQSLQRALDQQRNDIKISVFQKPVDPSARFAHAITEAMLEPVTFYSANITGADQQSSTYLGYFVYVNGAFHYADTEVYQMLSTMPPLRIRQGAKVTAASIIRQDRPIYPEDARTNHIEGAVVLHAIIGVDGAVKELTVVSGDSTLAQAATDAVWKWRYKPTLLEGKPVVVDTTITVTFQLNR